MSEIRLVFQDGSSNKFWHASVSGTSFNVHYGRIGTDGQKQEKKFATEVEARKAYDKKVAEKQKEGYREGAPGPEPEPLPKRPMIPDSDGEALGKLDGRSIKLFEPGTPLKNLNKTAYKFLLEYDQGEDGEKIADLLAQYLEDPRAAETEALVIGAWEEVSTGTPPDEMIEALVSAREQLPGLSALYFGDIMSEESEISWINQGDLSPLFLAFPRLAHLVVRGGTRLSLGKMRHELLRSLIVESGGLPSSVVREIGDSELPALEYLELWLGEGNYGGDATVDDLQPILSGKKFPKLRYLGLCDSENQDAIAAAVAASPILERLEVLDLSMGTLSDEGARALLASPAVKKLRFLNLRHHYMSNATIAEIRKLGIRVDVSDQEKGDEDDGEVHRYIEVSE